MRVILLVLIFLSFVEVHAQTPLDHGLISSGGPAVVGMQQTTLVGGSWHKQWQLRTFGGLSAHYGFLNPGGNTVFSAPVGLQLTRRLNTNWYAFAEVSAAPAYFNLYSPVQNIGFNKTYSLNGLFNPNQFGIYSGAAAGLQYVNDAKTFSISGSMHIDRARYPLYPAYPTGVNRQQPVYR